MRVGYFQQFLLVRVTDLQQSLRILILDLKIFVVKIELAGVSRVRRQTQADAPLESRRSNSFEPARQNTS